MTFASRLLSVLSSRLPEQAVTNDMGISHTGDGTKAPTQYVSNEANVIAHIRSLLFQLKAIGIQFRRNHLHQSEAYAANINAPSEPGLFTQLDEANRQLYEDYDDILLEIDSQLGAYDRYCELHGVAYSPTWNLLLAELKNYQSGISCTGIFYHKEVMAGFVSFLPSTK